MKKYTKPVACVVELQAKENIALNPIDAATVTTGGGTTTTTYDMSLFGANS